MTTWTSPRTWAPGVLTSAALNTDVRDNELYLKEVIGGTNADKIPGAALATLLALPASAEFYSPSSGVAGRIQWVGDQVFYFENARWDGTNWVRDDTTRPAWVMRLGYSGDDQFYIKRAAAGANPITWTTLLAIDNVGKITGKGIFTSVETSIANGVQASIAHGFGSPPRFIFGFYNVAAVGIAWPAPSGNAIGVSPAAITGLPVRIASSDSSNIYVKNESGATVWVYIHAIF